MACLGSIVMLASGLFLALFIAGVILLVDTRRELGRIKKEILLLKRRINLPPTMETSEQRPAASAVEERGAITRPEESVSVAPPPAPAVTPPRIEEARPVAAPPAPEPSAPKKTPSEKREQFMRWERFLGTSLFAWVGILAVLIGSIFLAKLALEHDLITDAGKTAAGFLFGCVLLGLGYHLERRDHPVLARSLMGGGIGVWHVTLFAAYGLYHLIEPGTAVVVSAAVTFAALALAGHFRSQIIMVVGALGAYLLPVLLSDSFSSPGFFFIYLLMVTGALLLLARGMAWRISPWVAMGGMAMAFLTWMDVHYKDRHAEGALLFLLAHLALYFGAAFLPVLLRSFSSRRDSESKGVPLAWSLPFMLVSLGTIPVAIPLLIEIESLAGAHFYLIWTILFAALSFVTQTKFFAGEGRREGEKLLGFMTFFLALAALPFAIGFLAAGSDNPLAADLLLSLAAYGVALLALAKLPREKEIEKTGVVLLSLPFFLLFVLLGLMILDAHNLEHLTSACLLTGGTFILAQGFLLNRFGRRGDRVVRILHQLGGIGLAVFSLIAVVNITSYQRELGLPPAIAAWALFFAAQWILIGRLLLREKTERLNLFLAPVMGLLIGTSGWALTRMRWESPTVDGCFLLGVAAVYLLPLLRWRQKTEEKESNAKGAYALTGIASLLFFVSVWFDDAWWMMGWMVLGLLLLFFSSERGLFGLSLSTGRVGRLSGPVIFVLFGAVPLLLAELFLIGSMKMPPVPFYNARFLSLLFLCASLGLFAARSHRWGGKLSFLSRGLEISVSPLLLYSLWGETARVVRWARVETEITPERLSMVGRITDLMPTLYLMVLGFILVAAGLATKRSFRRWMGIGFLTFAVGKVFIIDLAFFETLYRVIASIALGVFLLIASYIYRRFLGPLGGARGETPSS